MACCQRKFLEGPACKSPEGAGGGGEYSPHSNPPFSCRTGYGGFTDFRCKAATQGFGGVQQFRITPEMGIDIQRILGALSSFVKDGGVTISIEVETLDELSKPAVIDGSIKRPTKLMNLKFRVGNSLSCAGGEKKDDSHRFNASDAMHGDGNGQGLNEAVSGKPSVGISTKAGDVNV